MIILLIVTLTSMLVAVVMSTIAWRIAGDERRRSEVRVAALAAEIHEDIAAPVAVPALAGASRRDGATLLADTRRAPLERHERAFDLPLRPLPRSADLFVQTPRRSSVRMFAVLSGGGAVFAVAVAMAILVPARLGRQSNPVQTPAIAPAARPLELVALEHERLGDQLTVRGVVRNPAAGVDMGRLTAVVVLLSPDGGLVETGRAAVDAAALRAGGESAFAVTVPRAGDVGRYRVSFRTDDQVVSHVDRRHEPS